MARSFVLGFVRVPYLGVPLVVLLAVGCGLRGAGLLGSMAETDAGNTPLRDGSLSIDGPVLVSDASGDSSPPLDAPGDSATGGSRDVEAGGDAAGDAGPLDSGRDQGILYPATCVAAGVVGDVTLFVGGDPSKPWPAHCVGSTTYLKLPPGNVSTYPYANCASGPGPAVSTTWSMVKIDPVTFVVDTSDFTFATSTGSTTETSTQPYTHLYTRMLFASTRSCDDVSPQPPLSSVAAIDLTGTNFAVSASQQWGVPGFSNNGGPFQSVKVAANGQRVTLAVGGFPAGISPCAAGADYYTMVGGACLQLVYGP